MSESCETILLTPSELQPTAPRDEQPSELLTLLLAGKDPIAHVAPAVAPSAKPEEQEDTSSVTSSPMFKPTCAFDAGMASYHSVVAESYRCIKTEERASYSAPFTESQEAQKMTAGHSGPSSSSTSSMRTNTSANSNDSADNAQSDSYPPPLIRVGRFAVSPDVDPKWIKERLREEVRGPGSFNLYGINTQFGLHPLALEYIDRCNANPELSPLSPPLLMSTPAERLAHAMRTVPSTTVADDGCVITKGFVVPPKPSLERTCTSSSFDSIDSKSSKNSSAISTSSSTSSLSSALKHPYRSSCSSTFSLSGTLKESQRSSCSSTFSLSSILKESEHASSSSFSSLSGAPRRDSKVDDDDLKSAVCKNATWATLDYRDHSETTKQAGPRTRPSGHRRDPGLARVDLDRTVCSHDRRVSTLKPKRVLTIVTANGKGPENAIDDDGELETPILKTQNEAKTPRAALRHTPRGILKKGSSS